MDKKTLCKKSVMTLFPKVELHRHIEGSFDLPTLFEISKKNKIDAPKQFEKFKDAAQFPKNHPPDFKLFLSKFRNDWYRSLDDVNNLVYNSVKGFKNENLHYLELRFSPEHFAFVNNFDRVETCNVLMEAGNTAAKECDFEIKYLITFNRNKQTQEEMLALYKKLAKAGAVNIIGYDLAGDELLNPAEEFVELFNVINKDNIGITIHAGEVTPPAQVWAAIDKLHATRIGHGTVSIKDKKLQEALIERKICLEQCPVSNYFTGAWVQTSEHPFKQLNDNGVLVTLNSDDPTIQNTNLIDDFIIAAQYYVKDMQELVDLNVRSLEAAFLKQEDKKRLIISYKAKIENFIAKIKVLATKW